MLRSIEIAEGKTIVVEVEEISDTISQEVIDSIWKNKQREKGISENRLRDSLPPGAETVSTSGQIERATSFLEDQIESLGGLAREILTKTAPEEVVIEAHVKFAGDTKIIPFLVTAKGEGGLKLTLKWKKPRN